jgi:predicted aspartyl protease
MRLPVGLTQPISLFPAAGDTPVPIQQFIALLDTGASRTCITGEMATAIKLPLMGKTDMITASDKVPTNVYMVDFFLPFGQPGKADFLRVADLPVMEYLGGGNGQILLGMDVLRHMVLSVVPYDSRFTICI